MRGDWRASACTMLPRSIVARLLLAIVAVLLLRGSPLISVVTAKKLSKLLPQLDSSTFDSFVGYKPLCLAVFTSKCVPQSLYLLIRN